MPVSDLVLQFQIMSNSGAARICCEEGQRWKLCHGPLTVDLECSSCSMTDSFVTNAVLIERAVNC